MSDICRTKTLEVEVQENGIIRGPDGRIIARLAEGIFEDLVEGPVADLNETREMIKQIVNLRAKGEITRSEANRRIKNLAQEEEARKQARRVARKEAQAKANRGVFRKILDFLTP